MLFSNRSNHITFSVLIILFYQDSSICQPVWSKSLTSPIGQNHIAISKDGKMVVASYRKDEQSRGSMNVVSFDERGEVIFDSPISGDYYFFDISWFHISPDNNSIVMSEWFTYRPKVAHPQRGILLLSREGKILFRREEDSFLGFMRNGSIALLGKQSDMDTYPPCEIGESQIEYSCLDLLDLKEGKIVHTIRDEYWGETFYYINVFNDSLIVIIKRNQIYMIDTDGNRLWEKRYESYLRSWSLQVIDELNVISFGVEFTSIVLKPDGSEIWSGEIIIPESPFDEIPEHDFFIEHGYKSNDTKTVSFWKKPWNFVGHYFATEDELNLHKYGDKVIVNNGKYDEIKYSEDGTAAITTRKVYSYEFL